MSNTFKVKNPYLRIFLKWISNFLTPTNHNYLLWEKKNRMLRRAGMKIGINVAIDRGFTCLTGQEEFIRIDDYSAIGIGNCFLSFNHLHIGRFCMFASDVTVVNGGHDVNTLEPFSGQLTIGNGCWIGNGARIIGPISIGDNAIVAAGAVVIKDVPAGAVVAGVPARVIKMRDLSKKQWHLGGDYFSPQSFELIKEEVI